jgi:HEAT repeat protein
MKSARRRQPGFRDVLKNPQLWNELVDQYKDVDDAIKVAKSWNNEELATAVRAFVFDVPNSRDAWAPAKVLHELGNRTHADLILVLRDSTMRQKLLKPTSKGKLTLPEAPFNRLCDLLDGCQTPEVVKLLAPYLDDPSDEIRKSAALVIGSIGSKSIVSPIQKALQDSDEYVRSYALMGLQRALQGKHLTSTCRRELFGDLQTLVSEGKNADKAAELLLDFDQERAIDFFLSDSMLTTEAKALHYILRALNAKSLLVPRNRLLSLIGQLNTRELEYPQSYQLGEALRSLGKHRLPEDRATLEEHLSHSADIVAEGAAAGLVASHGLDGFRERNWRTLKERGLAALTAAQRHYNAVLIFDAEVNNGGLSQYFFNSSGDEWKAALAGLEAMGSTQRLAILREALDKFGYRGPSIQRDKRMTELSKLVSADEEIFGELDSRYYKSTEVIDVLATRYVLNNPDEFD